MEINISHDSWHYRFYSWWQGFSNFHIYKSGDFRENLCHYMRVVLIWAPLGWFLRKPILGGGLRPWIVWVALMVALGTIIGLSVNPVLTISFWVLNIGFWVFVALIGGLLWLVANTSETVDRLISWGIVIVTAPVWVPAGIAYVILRFLWHRVIKPLYFARHRFLVASWGLTLLAIPVAIYLIWGTNTLVNAGVLLILGVVACIGLLVIGFLVLEVIPAFFRWIVRLLQHRRYSSGHYGLRIRRPGISTANLLREYRRSKWGTVFCPFIKLPHQWE